MHKPPIFLIGYMCSGKTTLGLALSRVSGLRFIDLDQEIEREAGMSVSDIFRLKGEPEFRRLEECALRCACTLTDVIVACGGGTPCREGAIELMNASGVTVLLQPSRERLLRRLMEGRRTRPKLAAIRDEAEMDVHAQSMLAERMPFYGRCMLRLDSSLLESPQEIDHTVGEAIKLLNL